MTIIAIAAITAAAGLNGLMWLERDRFVINETDSLPPGLYERVDGPANVGDLVAICPPAGAVALGLRRGYIHPVRGGEAGECHTGAQPLLKRIAAGPGDHYVIAKSGVTINGERLANSTPSSRDYAGRPLWDQRQRSGTLGDRDILPMSDYTPFSYDGRYFGPIDKRTVLYKVRPAITFPNHP